MPQRETFILKMVKPDAGEEVKLALALRSTTSGKQEVFGNVQELVKFLEAWPPGETPDPPPGAPSGTGDASHSG